MSIALSLGLPPVVPFKMASQHVNGWSDNYGAVRVAAAYAGYPLAEPYFIRGIWHHGCFGPWEAYTPHMLACNAPGAQKLPVLTAREEEAALLRAHGYPQARAIGLPILYAPPSGRPRVPRSLLVMPCHTLIGHTFSDRTLFRAYAREVAQAAKRFDRVLVCVHPNCQENGLWINEFKAEGLEVIDGARTNDLNSLARMRALFEQFETVTTNGWGSHVAYALAFGAKVSIHGTYPAIDEDNLLKDETWAADRAALKQALSEETKRKEAEFLRDFLVPPAEAVENRALGEWLVGAGHRLEPAQMEELLRTIVDGPTAAADARGRRDRILFVFHEASLTGAPINLLHFLRWLRANTAASFDILIGKTGPLHAELFKVATVFDASAAPLLAGPGRRYGLIYANTLCCGALVRSLQGAGARVVTHIHELDTCYEYLAAYGVARVLRQTQSFIACSEFVRDRAVALTGLAPEVFSVHPEIGDAARARERAAQEEASCREVLERVPADALVVGVCGTADLRKGCDLFIQLAGLLHRRWKGGRPLRFMWVGRKKSDVLEIKINLHSDLRRLLPQDAFIWAGEHANCLPLVARIDVFCLTSREDPYPLAMLEAAALGRPIVAFRQAGGGEDFCDRGGGTAVPFLDLPAYADAVLAYLEDDELRRAAGEKAARLVEERHGVDVLAPALWAHVQTLLAEPAPAVDFAARLKAWAAVPAWDESPFVGCLLPIAEILAQAEAMLNVGKTSAAVPVVIKAAQLAMKYRDLPSILASLGLVADTLDRIDAKQAKMIRDQAETLARNHKVAPALFQV